MPSELQKILVFGSTGLIGKRITNALLKASSEFVKIGVFTSPDSLDRKRVVLDGYRAGGAEIIVGDLRSEQDVLDAYKGLYFLCGEERYADST
jgi:uncharacterized protein YbjT (DUF2867 family)